VELCENAEKLFQGEKSVLELSAPVKIFGDLHGQFGDLMRLFEECVAAGSSAGGCRGGGAARLVCVACAAQKGLLLDRCLLNRNQTSSSLLRADP